MLIAVEAPSTESVPPPVPRTISMFLLAASLVRKELPMPPLPLTIVPPLTVQVEFVTGTTRLNAVVTANVWPLSIVREPRVVALAELLDNVSDPSLTLSEETVCGVVADTIYAIPAASLPAEKMALSLLTQTAVAAAPAGSLLQRALVGPHV